MKQHGYPKRERSRKRIEIVPFDGLKPRGIATCVSIAL